MKKKTFQLPVETKRTLLRTFCLEDAEAFQGYRSDPVLARFQGWEVMSEEACHSFLQQQMESVFGEDGEWLQVAIVRKDTNELIGDIGICSLSAKEGRMTLGFTLAQGHQKQGFAAEAVKGLLEALFSNSSFSSAQARTDARNEDSIRLLERLGFRLLQTEEAVFRGKPCVEHVFLLEKTSLLSE